MQFFPRSRKPDAWSLIKNYGFQSEAAVDLSGVIKRFEVARAYEGPQILLSWEFFDNDQIAECKIMKKEGAYPLSVNDGIAVFSGSASGIYGDLEINGGTIYYYTLFVKPAGETDFVFDTISMGKAMAIKTGYYQNKLWELSPQVYQVHDQVKLSLQKAYIK